MGDVEKDAVLSEDGRYRYRLTRRWAAGLPMRAGEAWEAAA